MRCALARRVDDDEIDALTLCTFKNWAEAGGRQAITAGLSVPRRSPQFAALGCGSRSITTTVRPAAEAATATPSAVVVLALPPFWPMIARTFMDITLYGYSLIFLDGEPRQ